MLGPALAAAGFFCVLAVLAYALVRHVYLAALTVASSLCMLAVTAIMLRVGGDDSGLMAPFLAPLCSLLLNDRLCRSICAGAAPRDASVSAVKEIAAAAGPILAAYLLMLFACDAALRVEDALVGGALIAVAFAVTLGLGLVASRFYYPEEFIARANAARERRERMFERPLGLSETRWSLAVSGIALVLAAVAVFGMGRVSIDWNMKVEFAGSAVLITAAFAAILRNWRLAVAAAIAAMLAGLLDAWMIARSWPDFVIPVSLRLAIVPELVAMSMLLLLFGRAVNRGDAMPTAISAVLREQGGATVAAFLMLIAATATVLAAMSLERAALVLFTPVITGLAAALLFFPAFGNTLHRLLPRYRSVDEVFGRR